MRWSQVSAYKGIVCWEKRQCQYAPVPQRSLSSDRKDHAMIRPHRFLWTHQPQLNYQRRWEWTRSKDRRRRPVKLSKKGIRTGKNCAPSLMSTRRKRRIVTIESESSTSYRSLSRRRRSSIWRSSTMREWASCHQMSGQWWALIRRPRLRLKNFIDRVRWQPRNEWVGLQMRELRYLIPQIPTWHLSFRRSSSRWTELRCRRYTEQGTEAWVGSFLLSVQASQPSGKQK